MIPDLIKQKIFDYCRKNSGVRVTIHLKDNPYPLYGLSFDINGKAKVLEGNLDITTYISNHLKYAREPVDIKVNGLDLKDITPLPLALPLLPPEPIKID